MDHRDYSYYEANSADISFEDITSSEQNKQILRRLRDGDDKISHLTLGIDNCKQFSIRKGDNLGWLGYFIGRSVKIQFLDIWHLNPRRWEREQQIDAFMFGLARNQSIRRIRACHVRGYESTALLRGLGNLSLLEELDYRWSYITLDGCSALGTLLESGVCKLKKIHLMSSNIDDDGVAAFANGLRSIGPFLRELLLPDNSIGNEGLLALVTALESCTSLERLNLSDNDFSLATAGLGSLSDWLQTAVLNLNELSLQYCAINDEGMQALAEGALNHCKDLNLSGNDSITASGFRYLSTSLQSNSCRLEKLCLGAMNIGDDGVEVLVRGLIGNKVLRCLELRDDEGDIAITTVGWYALSTALCDTSTVNNTYLSNHTVHFEEPYEDEDIDESVVLYLQLNEKHPQYAAGCKILMNHAHLDMAPLLQWELKFLPLAVGWFEGAKSCTTLSIDEYNYTDYRRRVLEESEEAFQSRILTALYEFVRGVTEKVLERRDELALVAACDDKIAMVEEENMRILNEKKRLREDVEERDRKIAKLEEENKRLRGIVESERKSLED